MKRYDTTDSSFVTELTEANKVNQPELVLENLKLDRTADINDLIAKKQTITIYKDEFEELYKILPRYVKQAIRTSQIDEYYSQYNSLEDFLVKENVNLQDGYNMLEYNGSYGFTFVAGNVLYYIKKYDPESISVNLYSISGDNKIPELFKSKAVGEPDDIPELDYMKDIDMSEPKKYSYFKDRAYSIIRCQNIDVPCLFVNLPYEYYSEIKDLDYLAYYDFQKNGFYFTGTPYSDLIKTANDIAENGIKQPLYLKVSNGNVVCTLESHDKLVIAKMLKLPYIPVCLYLTPLQTAPYEILFDKKNKDNSLINSICEPYFSF